MSSASQLFSTRRPRGSRGSPNGAPPPPSTNHNHHHHHHHHHHLSHHNQVDVDDPQLLHSHNRNHHRRQICSRRLFRNVVDDDYSCVAATSPSPLAEHEFNASTNGGITELSTGNGSQARTANNRIYDLRFGRNDRLPGTVLQARARLLERLRGTSFTGIRHSRTASDTSRVAFATNGAFPVVDFSDWDPEYPSWWHEGSPSAQSDTQLEPPWAYEVANQKLPVLSCDMIDSLKREIFKCEELKDDILHVSSECSICLEMFLERDGLIRLPCSHRFHPSCLVPWLRNHGDCPNCRASI